MADESQFEQIIMNLAVNARDAMPHGGILTVSTELVSLADRLEGNAHEIRPGRYITLSVSDTGTGMTTEIQEKIFEPLFTTKAIGKCTGLGLSTVYGIVKQHGGYIYVDSKLGYGTTFKVFFPTTEILDEEQGHQGQQDVITTGTETILIVDDDPSILKLMRSFMSQLGYRLHEAESVQEAMEVSRRIQGKLHLLLSDVIMADQNGRELAEMMFVERPETKVLFMSGYTDDIIARQGVLEPGVAFIQKPFTLSSLAMKIRRTLDIEFSITQLPAVE